MAERCDQESTTIHLADGRVLRGVRDVFLIAESSYYRRVGGSPWRWTLNGEVIDKDRAITVVNQSSWF